MDVPLQSKAVLISSNMEVMAQLGNSQTQVDEEYEHEHKTQDKVLLLEMRHQPKAR